MTSAFHTQLLFSFPVPLSIPLFVTPLSTIPAASPYLSSYPSTLQARSPGIKLTRNVRSQTDVIRVYAPVPLYYHDSRVTASSCSIYSSDRSSPHLGSRIRWL